MASDPNSSMAKESKVRLKSSDGEIFEVEHAVAVQSQIVKNVMEDTAMDTAVPLDNISSNILAKVIEYCEYHLHAAKPSEGKSSISEEDVKTWEQEFVQVDLATLFDLIMAAKYMGINNLLDLTCTAVADRIKEKSPQEIRKIFNIENDYTPEEEEEIKRQNQWAFD